MEKSLRAIKKCSQWLAYCLEGGWNKDDLDSLEQIWWKHHDYKTGFLKQLLNTS